MTHLLPTRRQSLHLVTVGLGGHLDGHVSSSMMPSPSSRSTAPPRCMCGAMGPGSALSPAVAARLVGWRTSPTAQQHWSVASSALVAKATLRSVRLPRRYGGGGSNGCDGGSRSQHPLLVRRRRPRPRLRLHRSRLMMTQLLPTMTRLLPTTIRLPTAAETTFGRASLRSSLAWSTLFMA